MAWLHAYHAIFLGASGYGSSGSLAPSSPTATDRSIDASQPSFQRSVQGLTDLAELEDEVIHLLFEDPLFRSEFQGYCTSCFQAELYHAYLGVRDFLYELHRNDSGNVGPVQAFDWSYQLYKTFFSRDADLPVSLTSSTLHTLEDLYQANSLLCYRNALLTKRLRQGMEWKQVADELQIRLYTTIFVLFRSTDTFQRYVQSSASQSSSVDLAPPVPTLPSTTSESTNGPTSNTPMIELAVLS